MKTREQLEDALSRLMEAKQLKKLTLSRPDDPSILRGEGHLFEKKGVCHLQIETFHKDGKATHVNYPLATSEEIAACTHAVFALMKDPEIGREGYAQINLISPLGDGEMRQTIGGGYDIVLANIVADVIIGLAPIARSLLAEGGVFLCSGIIDDRAEEVAEHLRAAGLQITETRSAEGWFAYTCK